MAVVFDVFEFYNILQAKRKSNSSNSGISSKILGLDYGTKKLGIAISDDTCQIAFPKETLINNWCHGELLIKEIIKQSSLYQTNDIVIGLPKKMNNTLDAKCEFLIQIANQICNLSPNYNILLFDERFSTKQTTAITRFQTRRGHNTTTTKAKKRPNTDKTYDDAQSASIILQDVLNIINSY